MRKCHPKDPIQYPLPPSSLHVRSLYTRSLPRKPRRRVGWRTGIPGDDAHHQPAVDIRLPFVLPMAPALAHARFLWSGRPRPGSPLARHARFPGPIAFASSSSSPRPPGPRTYIAHNPFGDLRRHVCVRARGCRCRLPGRATHVMEDMLFMETVTTVPGSASVSVRAGGPSCPSSLTGHRVPRLFRRRRGGLHTTRQTLSLHA